MNGRLDQKLKAAESELEELKRVAYKRTGHRVIALAGAHAGKQLKQIELDVR